MNDRWRTAKLVNWQFLPELTLTDGGYPVLQPMSFPDTVSDTLGFNEAMTCKHPEDKLVHFYLDDYQFERVWAQPERYIEILRRFPAVVQPDFSVYADYPEPLQRWNHYRNCLLGALFQSRGLVCLPSVNWADDLGWSLQGLPEGGTHVFSTVGGAKSKAGRAELLRGIRDYCDKLHPEQLLVYGKVWPELETWLHDTGVEWQRFAHGHDTRMTVLRQKHLQEVH